MFFPFESTGQELFFGFGYKDLEKSVQLSNVDFYKILPKITNKSFKVMKYFDLINKKPAEYNIILYHFPGLVGHWTLFCVNDLIKKIYFFDPYGREPDTQWRRLTGYDKFEKEFTILSDIINNYRKKGYKFTYNPYNIQGHFIEECLDKKCKIVAENECGELVCFRIIYKDLGDLEFYHKCMKLGPTKIFNIIKSIENEL